MSVIPLALGQTVVTTKEHFDHSGGRHGTALLIQNFDEDQLVAGSPNLSYDLRIGAVYNDHRDGGRRDVADEGSIVLLPGSAIIIETEEDVHMPCGMFARIDFAHWSSIESAPIPRFTFTTNRRKGLPILYT
jgi:hypothetical protein